MAVGGESWFLVDAAVFLGAAVVSVPVFKRLGLGSVIGYLAAGALIGPFGFGVVGEPQSVIGFAEFGVVLLLFVIGLELRPARLWRMRVEIFGLGAAQVALSGGLICGALIAFGVGWRAALTVGLALALSSTAFAVQMLREKGELTSPYGDRAFAILLFQDIAIVPLLALVAVLAPGAGGRELDYASLALALGAVAALVLVGRYGLQPLFTVVARAKADEILTAAALLVVIGSALLMQAVGLSMAMGAFIAGVLLAETEFRHQLESDIEPFRGLLLGLFFMGFGMSIEWPVVAANWWIVAGGALGLFALKGAVLWTLTRAMGSPSFDALRIGATLGQGGEFAFVLFGAAGAVALIDGRAQSLLSAVVTATMVLTPVAVALAARMRPPEDEGADDMEDAAAAPRARIMVAGFGRVGQVVGQIMRLRGHEVTLIDKSPRRIRMAGAFGAKVYYGDATRTDVLKSAGADEAAIIFLCIDDRDGARQAVERIKRRFPAALVHADTYDRFTEWDLREAGADFVIRETFESAVALAREGLVALGDAAAADEVVEEFRRRDAEMVRLQVQYGAVEGLQKLREKYAVDSPY